MLDDVRVTGESFHLHISLDWLPRSSAPAHNTMKMAIMRAASSRLTAALWDPGGLLPALRAAAMLCLMLIRLDLWTPRNWQHSSSASPEKLLCVYLYSGFISCARQCQSPPVTRCARSAGITAHLPPEGTEPLSTQLAAMSSQVPWHWRISPVVQVLMP